MIAFDAMQWKFNDLTDTAAERTQRASSLQGTLVTLSPPSQAHALTHLQLHKLFSAVFCLLLRCENLCNFLCNFKSSFLSLYLIGVCIGNERLFLLASETFRLHKSSSYGDETSPVHECWKKRSRVQITLHCDVWWNLNNTKHRLPAHWLNDAPSAIQCTRLLRACEDQSRNQGNSVTLLLPFFHLSSPFRTLLSPLISA